MGAFIPIAMGVGNGIIPNEAMRASSVYDRYHMPSQARLNKTKQGKNAGAWKPKINDTKQYLQVDLGAVSSVTQVCLVRCLVLNYIEHGINIISCRNTRWLTNKPEFFEARLALTSINYHSNV